MPRVFISEITKIVKNWYVIVVECKFLIVIYIAITILCYALGKRRKIEVKGYPRHKSIMIVILGAFFTVIGLFPYAVVRQAEVSVNGLNGRDAMLVCLGMAVLIYGCIEFIGIPYWGRCAILLVLVMTSCIHFSSWYCTYLKDYYQQVALQMEWREDESVKRNNTFIYIDNDEQIVNARNYYALNAMAKQVFGDSTRFFASNPGHLSIISSDPKKELYWRDAAYCFDEYDITDTSIDGVIEVSYQLSTRDVLQLKCYEIVDYDRFETEIKNYVDYKYYSIDENMSNEIYDMIESGIICNNEDLLQYVLGSVT